ncbi:hypothetical protein [Dermatobacter hominis]|uniref:hypothetical protein n=1 Tax=Dermatobacter hominis TaxID=2884263 RepID=UPI001D105AF5|nr:hypothetical protein [Dermatobacter hominis]UDY35623.1 hypothetical protein LH044_20110 [Dermatobacter hominis]
MAVAWHGVRGEVRTLHGDVPVWWTEAPGETTVGITFRVGWADEPLAWRGASHLVEHALLLGLEGPDLSVDGATGPYTTSVSVTGGADAVADAVARLCARAGDADLPRTALAGRRVLRAEAAAQPAGRPLVESMLVDLVGLHGPARSVLAEVGLADADEALVRRWIATWFVAGNAAVWSTGPAPPELDLPLPPGPRRPARPLVTLPGRPVHVRRPGAVGFLGLAGGGPAVDLALQVVAHRVRTLLRDVHGVSYRVEPTSLRCGGGRAVAGVVGDVVAGAGTTALRTVAAVVEDVATSGPGGDELDAARSARRRDEAHGDGGRSAAALAAMDHLMGGVDLDGGSDGSGLDVGPDEVRAALGDVLADAVWSVPDDAEPGDWAVPPLGWSDDPAPAGDERRSRDGEGRLVLADGALWIGDRWGGRSVDLRRPAGVLAWRDGTREVLRDDGHSLLVVPWRWPDGDAIARAVDEACPPEDRAELGFRGPAVPDDAWDVADRRRDDPAWDPDSSSARLLLGGAVLLDWLQSAGLLRPAVLGAAATAPDGTALADLTPVRRYRAVGAVFAPDMVTEEGRRFVDHLHAGEPRPIDAIWAALGGPPRDGFVALPDDPQVVAAARALLDDEHHRWNTGRG